MIKQIFLHITMLVCFCFFLPNLSVASDNILFIFDASGSMWEKVDGTTKMATARQTLGNLLQDIPKETKLGLLVYGLFSETSCDDVHMIVSLGTKKSHESIKEWMGKIQPNGKTPIAKALKMGGDRLSKYKTDRNFIILISDGIETCGGDPCQVAGALAEKGVNLKIHVIGFDVKGKARQQLECVAKAGKGRYFNADSTAGFKQAIAAVKKEVKAVEPAPKPKPTKPVEYFHDNFDGDDLGQHWEIINPDPDAFIVENGELLMINSTPASFAADNIKNLFHLNKPLPKGDWTATAKINIDFQTRLEQVFFGLYYDKDNYLVSIMTTGYDGNHARHYLFIAPTKALKGVVTRKPKNIWGAAKNSDLTPGMKAAQPILLRLEKKGREYISSVKLEGLAEPEWIELTGLKLLRPKGNLAIGTFQSGKCQGETTVIVDWVKIEVPGNAE